ncbi:hypothetical protein CCB80_03295 [Armatimonadetes bacterium Uphvl-Ar1]|nr:hypothetical protein CCB80_03295 [Armatimonadetes bacterium Uphvl-Ar1]
MAIGPLDELRTRLTLDGNFKKEADEAKKAAEKLSNELENLEDTANAVEEANGKMGVMMKNAMINAVSFSPVLGQLATSAAQASVAIGTNLGIALSNTVTFLTSPVGIAAGATIAAAAMMAMASAGSYLGGVMSGLLTTFAALAPTIATLAATIGGPLLAIPFMNAAKEMDRYERQFAAIFGGSKQGKQAAGAMQQYGLKSSIDQLPLAGMIKTLGLSGLDVNRYLPMMETFSFLGRGDASQNADDVSSIIRRLMGGQTSDALGPDGVGRLGINKKMLEMYGASFDSQGKFLGDTQDALDVLEKLSKDSPMLKDLKAVMEASVDTRWSNVMDAIRAAITDFGKTIKDSALPVFEKVAEWLRNLTNNGTITKLAEKMGNMIGDPEKLKPLVAGILTFLEKLPAIANLAVQMVQEIALAMDNVIKRAVNFMGSLAGPLGKWWLGEKYKEGMAGIDGVADIGKAFFSETGSFGVTFKKNLDLLNTPGAPKDSAFPASQQAPTDPDVVKTQELLAGIENNTRQMVEAQRLILGGGELGQQGITATSVFGRKSSGGGRRGGFVGDRLSSVLMDIFDEMIEGERRAMA